KVYAGGFSGKVFAGRSAAYLPLVIAGALLGAVAGWLLTAAAAYRVHRARPGRRLTTALLTAGALAAAALPVFAITRSVMLLATHLGDDQPVDTPYSVLRPGWWYLQSFPASAVTVCAIVAGVAGILALVSTWGRGPEPSRTAALPS